ncbi:hypothetical protein [Marinobacterium litorale]|uniref:hypothetical protein n=1 Tax=Marinobacterium litorale TaxID=404770 RepID=UPI000420F843|nr:hypothetical protein [Marinobacterium litorale]
MKISKTAIVLAVAVPLVLGSIGTAVFVYWDSIQAQQQANEEILQKFGFEIIPVSPYTESTGELGAKQVPATFAEDDLSPVEKVIDGLLKDKEKLLDENEALKYQITQLEEQVDSLEQYKSLNEQFAPETLSQELERTRQELARKIGNLREAQGYSKFWIEMMASAALLEYERFMEANRMLLDHGQREELIDEELVTYGFCVGNAVELAANNAQEARDIARWFENPDSVNLSEAIQADLDIVLPPCQIPLRKKLQASLSTGPAG